MKAFFNKYAVWVTLALFIVIATISLVGFEPTHALLPSACSEEDKGACFREWVSALSGWVGGAAAFITLIAIRHQIKLQQRQIDFQLGDAPPTMHATKTRKNEGGWIVTLTVRNWNRRPMSLEFIYDFGGKSRMRLFPQAVMINGEDCPFTKWEESPGTLGSCMIPGREEGLKVPYAEIVCDTTVEGEPDVRNDNYAAFDCILACGCHQYDSTRRSFVLTAELKDIWFSPFKEA
ncbi:hypothetical protein [Rhizobium leguminosarum]|uniref:hypothetical protein n=1 Tax=Rhizobium leguminosarum TaxID=384 RepID=UPI003F9BDCF0